MDEDSKPPKYSAMGVGRSLTPPKTSTVELCAKSEATAAAALLMGSFADYGKADPDIFAASVVTLFMRYPEAVVRVVTKQLPWRLKWLPSLHEIREALEDAQDPGRKFRVAKGTTPDTFPKEPRDKEIKGRRYVGGKVREDGKGCVSEKFGEWEGKPCIAQDDPNRPLTWREQRHYTLEDLMANADGLRDSLGEIRRDDQGCWMP